MSQFEHIHSDLIATERHFCIEKDVFIELTYEEWGLGTDKMKRFQAEPKSDECGEEICQEFTGKLTKIEKKSPKSKKNKK